jgi:hypothetical protein
LLNSPSESPNSQNLSPESRKALPDCYITAEMHEHRLDSHDDRLENVEDKRGVLPAS